MTATGDQPTQLAAIVFTDIVGYSRMMEEDEERTIRVLRQHNEIVLPLIERAGGEVVDAIGDGLFILFPSVREAVVCSVAIHEAIGAHNEDVDDSQRFLLRIGVHLGEIWRQDDRVFGNGVNVAARVQPFAPPGGVCITEDVYRQVSNKLSHEITSIGRHELKNISRRLELYHVRTGHEQSRAGGPEADEETARGELDVIKQRILQEREKIAQRHEQSRLGDHHAASGDESSFENKIESKVFSLVEKVMDKAISKWDEMPEEKKSKAVARIQAEIEKETRGATHVHIGGDRDEPEEDDESDGSSLASRFGTGIVFGAGFGLGYFYFGIGWMVWPFAILGVLPFAAGLLKAVKMLAQYERRRRDRPLELERALLRIAGKLGGKVTVVRAASEAGLPLDEVQQALDRMTTKGYVTQHVRETGIIEYEFPSLVPGQE